MDIHDNNIISYYFDTRDLENLDQDDYDSDEGSINNISDFDYNKEYELFLEKMKTFNFFYVAINDNKGAFGLSEQAKELYQLISNEILIDESKLKRDDPLLIFVIRTLGKKANNDSSRLYLDKISNRFKDTYYFKISDGYEIISLT